MDTLSAPDISKTDVSNIENGEYGKTTFSVIMTENVVLPYSPFLFYIFHLYNRKLLISQNKCSGTREFNLKYQKFGMNFHFEIPRVDCTSRGK